MVRSNREDLAPLTLASLARGAQPLVMADLARALSRGYEGPAVLVHVARDSGRSTAFVNALRFRPDAYTAAGKRSKVFWCVLTGVSMLLGFLSLPYPIGRGGTSMLFMIIGVVIAGIFLADVLPALKSVMRRAQGNRW